MLPAERIPPDVLEVLRCQQTLQPLTLHERGLYSPSADLVYPVQDGLVFMGYDEREHSFMQTVMEEERVFQTSPENFERDLDFLEATSIATVDLVNLVQQTTALGAGARGLEVGAANGWVSWLFVEAGFDMWLSELEANSLALGLRFGHPGLSAGKRVVSDATLAPFADGTFDLVVCKEFAHHVQDKRRLFAEANRVLRPGGLLVMMEPVRSLWSTCYEWRNPDPHTDHVIVWPEQYLAAIRSRGFRMEHQGAYFYRGRPGRTTLTASIKRRANAALRMGHPTRKGITWLYEHLLGASLVVLATKQRDVPRPPRPRIRLIPPLKVQATPADAPDYSVYSRVLQDAAHRLVRRPHTRTTDLLT
jgi:SAM-dependent methyltransferase